jgi:hypothetical protein
MPDYFLEDVFLKAEELFYYIIKVARNEPTICIAIFIIFIAVIFIIIKIKSKSKSKSKTIKEVEKSEDCKDQIKIATVLETRCVNNSSLSLQLLETENEYLEQVEISIKKTDGNSYGKGCFFWGVKKTSGNAAHDALNAVRSALILRLNLLEINEQRILEGKSPIRQVCGISSGKFVVGKEEKTIIGENEVLAIKAREAAVSIGTDIVITAKTWRLIEQYVIVEEIMPIKKDDGGTTRLFSLINIRSRPVQPLPTTQKELSKLLEHGAV